MATKGIVLGLDLGANSIGWALISAEFDDEGRQVEETGIVGAGVRVFPEGVENYDSSKEESRAVQRRTARAARRLHARRSLRRARLKAILSAAGLLPGDDAGLRTLLGPHSKGARPLDPYQLRALALDRKLALHELGVVLYHLNQRRGFKSNRRDAGETKETGVVKEQIATLAKSIASAGCRTLGEYLHRLRSSEARVVAAEEAHGRRVVRLRNRYTDRAMIRGEFELIWESQERYHPGVLTDDLRHALADDVMFWQRPYAVTEERAAQLQKRADGKPRFANLLRSPSVALCPLEPSRKRLERGHWLAHRFRILKEVNDLKIESARGGSRPLTSLQKSRLIEALSAHNDRSFEQLVTLLRKLSAERGVHPADAPTLGEHDQLNLARGGRTRLKGNPVEAALAKALGRREWAALPGQNRASVAIAVSDLLARGDEDDGASRDALAAILRPFPLSDEQIGGLLNAPWSDGHIAYSREAVEAMLPHLERGLSEHLAREAAYPQRVPETTRSTLPLPGGEITNPVVRRAVHETRKVVNAILREYGRPTRIVVEMARDMSAGPEERKRMSASMREKEEARERAKEQLRERGSGGEASREDVLRYLLWEEQGAICPYTGRAIQQSQLLSPELQIDHILPRWRSGDDSPGNKVLCFADANREKGDRTPYEWLSGSPDQLDQMLHRVDRMRRMPYSKRMRFGREEIADDAFTQRQLNDTRYISRHVAAYLSLLYPPELRVGELAVGTTRGGLTAELRRVWRLNRLLGEMWDAKGNVIESESVSKSRLDHRHHAIDAIVVALSTRRHMKRYSDALCVGESARSRGGEHHDSELQFEEPWPDLRASVQRCIDEVNVSHRVDRKIRGAFHKETYYGPTATAGTYVTRKSLFLGFSEKDLAKVRDPTVRGCIEEHLVAKGWKLGQAIPKDALRAGDPPRMKSGVPIRRVRMTENMKEVKRFHRPGDGALFRVAALGNNHHMTIAEQCDSQGRSVLSAAVIPMIEVARRVRRLHEPACSRDLGPGRRFVMTLGAGESVMIRDPSSGIARLCVIQKLSGSPDWSSRFDLSIRDARDARPKSEAGEKPFLRLSSFAQWSSLEVRKVTVDPLGRLHPAGD
ncbi:MAG: type II CRISPR RNA-guided endonuclease Cas9 [Planctomycetaceae bacterium]